MSPTARPQIRVAIDVAPVRAQPAGVGLYAALLAAALARRAPDAVTLIGARPEASALALARAEIPATAFRYRTYHAWMQLAADADARAAGATLAHYTNAAAPLVPRLPYVVTVHDLSLFRMPGSHPAARRLIVPLNLAAIARARAIVVPSRFTARELGRIGVSPRRVTVIAHAPTVPPDVAAHQGVAQTLGLAAGSYVLFIGTLEPRKNIVGLVEAWERLAAARPELRLVLVGAPGWHYGAIDARIRVSPYAERIVRPGYLGPDALSGLLRDCGAFAYVSHYEGFGMPVLDALAVGAAVVTSGRSAMAEAAGGAAVLVDPASTSSIASGIEAALERRAELIERGLARAARRSWETVADEHLALYRHAAAHG